MRKKISIEGIKCGDCVNLIIEELKELNGVVYVEVNFIKEYAILSMDSEVADVFIKYSLEDAGYKVVSIDVL